MKPPRSANQVRPTIEGAWSPDAERRQQAADVRSWHDKFRRIPPCPVCMWPFSWGHASHGVSAA